MTPTTLLLASSSTKPLAIELGALFSYTDEISKQYTILFNILYMHDTVSTHLENKPLLQACDFESRIHASNCFQSGNLN